MATKSQSLETVGLKVIFLSPVIYINLKRMGCTNIHLMLLLKKGEETHIIPILIDFIRAHTQTNTVYYVIIVVNLL